MMGHIPRSRKKRGTLGPHTIRKRKPKRVSAHPERQLSRAKGMKQRDRILSQLKDWTRRIEADIGAIDDDDLQFCVAFVLDSIADEENCGRFVMTEVEGSSQLKLEQIELDDDLLAAVVGRFGREKYEEARDWFLNWIRDNSPPLWWIGWRFEHIDIGDQQGRPIQVEIDYVVYCFHNRRTLGVTLWDGPTLEKTTILLLPRWRET
jgi:hypothetical protein